MFHLINKWTFPFSIETTSQLINREDKTCFIHYGQMYKICDILQAGIFLLHVNVLLMPGVLLKQLTCPQAGDLIMHMVVTTAVCLEANL